MTVLATLFFLLTGSEWAIESIITSALSKGLTESLFFGLQTVWDLLYSYDNSHYLQRLQVFRCELFDFLSVIESTLSKRYDPIVRFRLPLYSAVSFFIRGIRCE
jgi:hypothetical protein